MSKRGLGRIGPASVPTPTRALHTESEEEILPTYLPSRARGARRIEIVNAASGASVATVCSRRDTFLGFAAENSGPRKFEKTATT